MGIVFQESLRKPRFCSIERICNFYFVDLFNIIRVTMSQIIFKEEAFKIIGVCMEIHRTLGTGLKEVSYKDAMEIDFLEKSIPFQREKRYEVFYKGRRLRNPYYADFLLYDSIIVEVKACTALIDVHTTQALSYLAVAQKKLALLINFGEKSLTYKRILL